ncbi:MAG: tetratricopeptide repeat protein, partial [Candidatus Cloacimonetes bacterium]|nr:tetratricopeptide repeat protein [Candidatus Cloacimonadota bacterium]
MKVIIIFFLILSGTIAHALFYEEAGVRNAAMGEVGIASTNDASAVFWNPALLTKLTSFEINSDNRKYFWDLANDDLFYNFAALSFPLGNIGTFAFSGSQFDANMFQERRIGLHYGYSLFENRLALGASVHYFSVGYGHNEYTINDPFFADYGYSTSAFDVDVGITYKLNRRIRLGLVSKNLLEANIALDDNNDETLSRDIGFGIEYIINDKLLAAADIKLITNNPLQKNEFDFATGVEYNLNKIFDIRGGVCKDKVTSGFGINILKKEYVSKFSDPFSATEFINIKSFQIEFNYSFQYPFSGIETQYGDHYFGLEVKFSNSTDDVKKFSDFVPPKTAYVTKVQADSLSNLDVQVDTLEYKPRVLIDTVYVETEKIIQDTILIFTGVPDSTYIQKVQELNLLQVKYAHAKNNNRAQLHLLSSLELFYKGLYDDAIKECESAISIAPDITLSYIRLGSIYLKMNDIDKARFYWRKAKKMEPNNPEMEKINKWLE